MTVTYHFHNFPIGWSKISKCWNVTLPHPNFVIPYEIIIWPRFRKNRLIFRGCYQSSVCPMLSLWRIFVVRLRVWKHWPINFSMPNSDWVWWKKNFQRVWKISDNGFPTAEGQKSKKNGELLQFLNLCGWQPVIRNFSNSMEIFLSSYSIRIWHREIYRSVFSHSEPNNENPP